MIKGEKMSIKSKAKKIGKALLFKKLYSDLKAKKERRQEGLLLLNGVPHRKADGKLSAQPRHP